MKEIAKNIFPFLITIALWHLSSPALNPFGILCLIPIFYYMFCQHQKYWFGFGLWMCFLIDFNAGTLFLFSSVFLLMHALNIFFGVLENESSTGYYIKAFNMFLILASLFLFFYAVIESRFFFSFIFGIVWLDAWLWILYMPMVLLFRRISDA